MGLGIVHNKVCGDAQTNGHPKYDFIRRGACEDAQALTGTGVGTEGDMDTAHKE